MPGRILVIRGGALGDFILTLPALRLLRENFPGAQIEILGYRHITSLAEKRYYADRTRSIEYAPLARFFNPRGDLDVELTEYFSSFDQVISYIYDPDELFQSSLRKAGVRNLIAASPKILGADHAAYQLAQPLQQLALWLDHAAAEFFPTPEDIAGAEQRLSAISGPIAALHPGSGSEKKNWPIEHWQNLLAAVGRDERIGHFLLIEGESDSARVAALEAVLPAERVTVLRHLPLPELGAILARSAVYLGHDTGVSHLAAAAGARCQLLFGPTDPAIWAPANPRVEVLRAPDGDLSALDVTAVRSRLEEAFTDAIGKNCRD